MSADSAAVLRNIPGSPWPDTAVVVIDCAPASPAAIPASMRLALAGADAVLCETGIDAAILSLAPNGAFVERVTTNGHPALPRVSAIARAVKLASEGWRVVWLAAGDARPVTRDLAAAGVPVGDRGSLESAAARPYEPRSFATAMNGLAG
jgi:hypothetical protein